jgi:hypothetical protein
MIGADVGGTAATNSTATSNPTSQSFAKTMLSPFSGDLAPVTLFLLPDLSRRRLQTLLQN